MERPPNPDFRGSIRRSIREDLRSRIGNKIQEVKKKIVRTNGIKPTFTFYYYSCNPIKYAGYEQVKASLKSVCNQGEVFIGDYMSDDGIKELAEELGAIVLDVEKVDGFFFHESKIANKIMFESKSNFMVYCNFNMVYPERFDRFCAQFIKENNVILSTPKIQGQMINFDKKTLHNSYPGAVSSILYRPYIIHCRGYDERVGYKTGTVEYAIFLLEDFLKLKWNSRFLKGMIHRYYTWEGRHDHLKEHFNFDHKDQWFCYKFVQKLLGELDLTFESVVNSYW